MVSRGLTKKKLSVLVSYFFCLLFFSLLSFLMVLILVCHISGERMRWPRSHSPLQMGEHLWLAWTGGPRNIPGSLGIGVKAGLLPLDCTQLGLHMLHRIKSVCSSTQREITCEIKKTHVVTFYTFTFRYDVNKFPLIFLLVSTRTHVSPCMEKHMKTELTDQFGISLLWQFY